MIVLANAWNQPPSPVTLQEALDVFLVHLQQDRIPDGTAMDRSAGFSDRANLAYYAMLGIGKMGTVLPEDSPDVRRLLTTWPAIYKWSIYLFSTRIEKLEFGNPTRRATMEMLSVFWYTLSYRDLIRDVMLPMPKVVEIATRLWLEEADWTPESFLKQPVATCLFQCLLRDASEETLDRVVRAAGGKATDVAKLCLMRLQRILKASTYNAAHLSINVDLINNLCRRGNHPMRHAMLGANAIHAIAGALVKLSVLVNTSPDPECLDAMVASLGYLRNCLQSTDGFTWVSQAVSAGLLGALCDCSPRFSELSSEDVEIIEELVRMLPPYLVYRSVIDAVRGPLAKIERGPQKRRVEGSCVREAWEIFYELAQERIAVADEAEAAKGKQIICDNAKVRLLYLVTSSPGFILCLQCQKMGTKEDVRRCGGCLSTYYCSKVGVAVGVFTLILILSQECQETAWKEGDHKTMCKLKQRSRIGTIKVIHHGIGAFSCIYRRGEKGVRVKGRLPVLPLSLPLRGSQTPRGVKEYRKTRLPGYPGTRVCRRYGSHSHAFEMQRQAVGRLHTPRTSYDIDERGGA